MEGKLEDVVSSSLLYSQTNKYTNSEQWLLVINLSGACQIYFCQILRIRSNLCSASLGEQFYDNNCCIDSLSSPWPWANHMAGIWGSIKTLSLSLSTSHQESVTAPASSSPSAVKLDASRGCGGDGGFWVCLWGDMPTFPSSFALH